MKKERIARKRLNEMYLFFEKCEKESIINDKYKFGKKFEKRRGTPTDWYEYYGLFKLKNKKVGIDPKRFQKKIGLDEKILKCMSMRKTTYYYPSKKNYSDYWVHSFVDEINEIKKEFEGKYKLFIEESIKNFKKPEKLCPADSFDYACGILDSDEANMWANYENCRNEFIYISEIVELRNSLYAQFFHIMVSKIEAVSIKMYSHINPNYKKYARDCLYDNINIKKLSSRDLPSFKHHDKMYSIWNFLKHNNMSTYQVLKEKFPEILISKEYSSGNLAINYVLIDDKLIIDLLNGVKTYFIEWCELNLDENYERSLWDYEKWFVNQVKEEIHFINNPLEIPFYL